MTSDRPLRICDIQRLVARAHRDLDDALLWRTSTVYRRIGFAHVTFQPFIRDGRTVRAMPHLIITGDAADLVVAIALAARAGKPASRLVIRHADGQGMLDALARRYGGKRALPHSMERLLDDLVRETDAYLAAVQHAASSPQHGGVVQRVLEDINAMLRQSSKGAAAPLRAALHAVAPLSIGAPQSSMRAASDGHAPDAARPLPRPHPDSGPGDRPPHGDGMHTGHGHGMNAAAQGFPVGDDDVTEATGMPCRREALASSFLRDERAEEAADGGASSFLRDERAEEAADTPASQRRRARRLRAAMRAAGIVAHGAPSLPAGRAYGRIFARLPAHVDPALIARLRRILTMLVADGGAEAHGPRLDVREATVRVLTHRSPYPARRRERGRPTILVIADVSGSCAAFGEPACAVARAASSLGVPGADVAVITVFTPLFGEFGGGFAIGDMIVNGRIVSGPWQTPEHRGRVRSLDDLCRDLARAGVGEIGVVIALGDMDEAANYADLAARPHVQRFIWLDNYGSRMLGSVQHAAPARVRAALHAFSSSARRKTVYLVGCGNADSMIEGIASAMRLR